MLNRSNRGLKQIPFIPDYVFNVNLSFNELSKCDGLNIPSKLISLSLQGNELFSVPNLKHLVHCKYLNLSDNEIKTVDWAYLPPNLLVLNLNNNEIGTFINSANSNTVVKLHIENNCLKSLFIKSNYERVYASGNQIKKIRFAREAKLKIIDLSDNEIDNIVELPETLKIIDLKYNLITNVSFLTNSLVKRIDLTYNEIAEIHSSQVPACVNKICLEGNQLTSIPKDLAERCICDITNTDIIVHSGVTFEDEPVVSCKFYDDDYGEYA